MKIIKVTVSDLRRFILFPDRLYRDDPNYVPFLKADLKRTLRKLLFEDGTYTALLAEDDRGQVLGRVLFTIDRDSHLRTDRCGFFSMYECVDDLAVSRKLLGEMLRLLREQGAEYVSGSYFPYDPDNRRGIMVQGFERAPLIFTSYNPPYYEAQMLDAGLTKQLDTYEYAMQSDERTVARLRKLAGYAMRKYDFRVDRANFSDIDRDLREVCAVMQAATSELNYQQAPNQEEFVKIYREWKNFLDPDFLLIARSNKDDSPLGIGVALPDYFQVFQKMHGRMNPIVPLTERKRIHALRNILQYVMPEWQGRGVLPAIYVQMYDAAEKHRMSYIEAGTILETNPGSFAPIEAAGGTLARVYRIFCRKLVD